MNRDINPFSQNRQLFPREEVYSCNGLICGHLNRMKSPADIKVYLQHRQVGASMTTSLARARRCFCRKQIVYKNSQKEEIKRIKMNIQENVKLIRAMQTIDIIIPKDKREN